MLTQTQLHRLGIYQWEDYAEEFDQADLLLGNGFSINLSPQFRYDSLFNAFLESCQESEQKLFRSFGTSNFEAIQNDLQSAIRVNDLFGIPRSGINEAVTKLREGLIRAIESRHPRAADINRDKLLEVAQQLIPFGDIFTLNYDLHLYHLIMLVNDVYQDMDGMEQYIDLFWQNGGDNRFRGFVDQQSRNDNKRVFYLHGSLFIFNRMFNIWKLCRNSKVELIDCVSSEIQGGTMPLFVSEGSWQEKLDMINRNVYLRFVYNKLKDSSDNLVIFGTSLSPEQDKHILDAINVKNRHIAVSIYVGDKSEETLRGELYGIRSRLPSHDVLCVDSTSLFQF